MVCRTPTEAPRYTLARSRALPAKRVDPLARNRDFAWIALPKQPAGAQAQDDQKDYKDKNAPRHSSLLFKRLKPELAVDALTPNVQGEGRASCGASLSNVVLDSLSPLNLISCFFKRKLTKSD